MCIKPLIVRTSKDEDGYRSGCEVNCGYCWQCIKKYANDWSFRLYQEAKYSKGNLLVLLTYSDESVPMRKDSSGNNVMSLRKTDFQDFEHKLKRMGFKDVIFWCVGEYSPMRYQLPNGQWTSGERPHFHVIILNCPPLEALEKAWSFRNKQRGHVFIKSIKDIFGSVKYLTKYLAKDLWRDNKNDCREKPKMLCSSQLGLRYLTPEMLAWHRADFTRTYGTMPGGYKVALCRYYLEKIYEPVGMMEKVSDYRRFKFLELEKIRFTKLSEANKRLSYYSRLSLYNEARNRKPKEIWDF